jgi:hypothetical protein
MSGSITVHANFSEDLRQHFLNGLVHLGAKPPKQDDVRAAGEAYFNVRRRLIPATPRHAVESRELQARSLTSDERKAIDAIIAEIECGADLRPRLSRSIERSDFNDHLLNDWWINHLHIGNVMQPNGFIERDGPLLYIFVTSDSIYLIDLLEHGADSWANERLMEIMHSNWPDVIAFSRALGVVPGSLDPPSLKPESRAGFRGRINMAFQAADGTIYVPTGGGTMTSGVSVEVVRHVNLLRTMAHRAESWVKENGQRLRDEIARQTGHVLDELRLRFFGPEPDNIYNLRVLETVSRVIIRLPVEDAKIPLS